VCCVRLGVQCHVATVGVELPHEGRVGGEGLGGSEGSGVVGTPEASGTAKGGQA